MSVRVSIAPGCTGMGSCVRLAPQVFRIDGKSGLAEVLLDDCSAHREAVLAAAGSCPLVKVEVDGVAHDEPLLAATVIATSRLTPDIIELRLRCPGFAFVPGQYVFIRLRDAPGEFFRTYSVVSADAGEVVLCIRLLTSGRAGRVLLAIQPGTAVGLSRAKGRFTLQTPDQPKLFVTGGTGLAPVLPMCRAAPAARKVVIVGARRPDDLFWTAELAAIPNTEVVTVVREAEPGWHGQIGQVTDALESFIPSLWPEVYTCGSPRLVEGVQATLVARGFAPERIHSDSFLAAGSASRPALPPAPLRARRDWPGLLRRLHVLTSAPLALIILFYAATGFIANRSELFIKEGQTTALRTLPAGTAPDREHLAPVLAAMLPQAVELRSFTDGADPEAVFAAAGGRAWTVSVVGASGGVRIREFGELAAGVEFTPAGVAAALAPLLSGDADLAHASLDEGELQLEFASVWGSHRVKAEQETRRWSATSIQAPLVTALVDLHRGKHAGRWQRFVVDATALGLAFVTLSGGAMALMTTARRRRRLALILLSSSAVLLLLLLVLR